MVTKVLGDGENWDFVPIKVIIIMIFYHKTYHVFGNVTFRNRFGKVPSFRMQLCSDRKSVV